MFVVLMRVWAITPHTKCKQQVTKRAMRTKKILYTTGTEPEAVQMLPDAQTYSATPLSEIPKLKCDIEF